MMFFSQSSHVLRLFCLFALAASVSGCGGDNIRSDYDPSVNFADYQTYNFFENAGPESSDYQSFFSQYMVAAISREMEGRGYVKDDDPDLLINFNAILQEKTQVRETPAPMAGGYYSYRGGFYDPWMGYGYATETHVSQYTEGTFNIDIVDARRKKLVWEAVGVGRVSQKDIEELDERVEEGVTKFFARYPFVAGSSTPQPAQE